MRTLNKFIILILSGLLIQAPRAFILSPSDTLKVSVSGVAIIENESPFGIRLNKHAGVNFSSRHQLHNNAFVYLSIDGKKRNGIPFLNEGYATLRNRGYILSIGVFRNKIGECGLYNAMSVYNPKFDKMMLRDVFGKCQMFKSGSVNNPTYSKWMLWNVQGTGFTLEKRIEEHALQGSFMVDLEKNKSFYLLYKKRNTPLRGAVLFGIRSKVDTNKDDHIVAGTEVFFRPRILAMHLVAKYDQSIRFNAKKENAGNRGKTFTGLLEGRVNFLSMINWNVLLNYKNYSDRRKTESIQSGIFNELLFFNWFGFGYGIELFTKDDNTMTLPEIYLLFKPFRDYALIKLGFNTRKENGAASPGKWSGSLWIEL